MPTYEFRCSLGHTFDRFFRKISDSPAELECPECGAVAARLVSGGAGLLFKGSGFYLTDYGKNAHRGEAKSNGSATSGATSSGGESKSADAKPAESTAAKPAEAKSDTSSKTSKADSAAASSSTSSSGAKSEK